MSASQFNNLVYLLFTTATVAKLERFGDTKNDVSNTAKVSSK